MRFSVLSLIVILGGCTWRPSVADDCARLRTSAGFAEVDKLSGELVRVGNPVRGKWEVCSSHPDYLDAFEADARSRNLRVDPRRHAEVGWCSDIPVTLEATSANVREASDVICRVAASHRASFLSFSATFGDKFLWIHPRSWSLSWLRSGATIRRG
jgi:hypothetical protein